VLATAAVLFADFLVNLHIQAVYPVGVVSSSSASPSSNAVGRSIVVARAMAMFVDAASAFANYVQLARILEGLWGGFLW